MSMFRSFLGNGSHPPIFLTYDTTFKLGDFYVSVLTFRHPEFSERPVIPLMYMIHDRKWKSVHHFFFKKLRKYAPELKSEKMKGRIVIASDDESAIVSGIAKFLPEVPHFRCWIHTWKNIKFKLRSSGITNKLELKEYKHEFLHLLKQPSEPDYQRSLIEKVVRWSKVICMFVEL